MIILNYLDQILGDVPLGYEFIRYIFGFILLIAGLYLIVQTVMAFLDLFR